MRIVNLKKEKYTIYIGRGSIFGNPFVIGKDGNREDVIIKYEKWARKKLFKGIEFTDYSLGIYDLPKNAILGCFCKPLACHGDIIMKIWKELHNELE